MKDSAFIIFNKQGVLRMVKGRHSKYESHKRPALAAGEHAIFLTFEVPDTAFAPRPTPSATISVPEEKILAPAVDVQIEQPPEL